MVRLGKRRNAAKQDDSEILTQSKLKESVCLFWKTYSRKSSKWT